MTDIISLLIDKILSITESALPFDGIFDVKLAKRGNNLGIVVRSEAENTKGEPVIISDVQVGSVAYRLIYNNFFFLKISILNFKY